MDAFEPLWRYKHFQANEDIRQMPVLDANGPDNSDGISAVTLQKEGLVRAPGQHLGGLIYQGHAQVRTLSTRACLLADKTGLHVSMYTAPRWRRQPAHVHTVAHFLRPRMPYTAAFEFACA